MDTQDLWDEVCGMLPEGWEVRIELESGAGNVTLVDPYGDEKPVEVDDASLEDKVREAVKIAVSRDEDY